MERPLEEIVAAYDPSRPLAEASTIPASWYTDERIAELERQAVFGRTWQMVGRVDQVAAPRQYVTGAVAGEPVVVVRGSDNVLRAFFNVCRHHAAAVMTEPAGSAQNLRCPYHGWTYSLEGALKGTPEFTDVCNFDRAANGLVPIRVESWENFVFINLDSKAPALADFLGSLVERVRPLGFSSLHFYERRIFDLQCNWKVFLDNYLDGGYHVPHLHKSLDSILNYSQYTIENQDRFCLQTSPVESGNGDQWMADVRKGRAYYYWQYPNLMLNWYEGFLETNLVLPLALDRMRVVFDFYFSDVSEKAAAYNRQSMDVSGRVQDEDHNICESVQRGLASRAYSTGRLSVRREAGEHLFHRLLAESLRGEINQGKT